MKILHKDSADYPELLTHLFDPPEKLYVEGDARCLKRTCVAVVGTRLCTPHGEALAFEIGQDLARAGVCVVSGLAFGIDAAAHRGALEAGGVTAAVIAQPLQNLMPVKHRSLAREIVDKGGVILSEKAPGMESFKVDYLIRNRVIAGLCSAVVVVEAGARSGAKNTATHALEQGRLVFAVPGRVTDAMSVGCNELLWKGAQFVRSGADILECLDIPFVPKATPELVGLEQRVVELVRQEPRHVGELVELCGVDFAALYETLCHLEMKGALRQSADQRYGVGR